MQSDEKSPLEYKVGPERGDGANRKLVTHEWVKAQIAAHNWSRINAPFVEKSREVLPRKWRFGLDHERKSEEGVPCSWSIIGQF